MHGFAKLTSRSSGLMKGQKRADCLIDTAIAGLGTKKFRHHVMKIHHDAGAMLRYRKLPDAAISQPRQHSHSWQFRLEEFNQRRLLQV
jgi:hypothetical protein